MVIGHNAEHAATLPQHLAFGRNVRAPDRRAFADDIIISRQINFLQEVMQFSMDENDLVTIIEKSYPCDGRAADVFRLFLALVHLTGQWSGLECLLREPS